MFVAHPEESEKTLEELRVNERKDNDTGGEFCAHYQVLLDPCLFHILSKISLS